VLLVNSSSER